MYTFLKFYLIKDKLLEMYFYVKIYKNIPQLSELRIKYFCLTTTLITLVFDH